MYQNHMQGFTMRRTSRDTEASSRIGYSTYIRLHMPLVTLVFLSRVMSSGAPGYVLWKARKICGIFCAPEEERKKETKSVEIAALDDCVVGLTNKGHVLKIDGLDDENLARVWTGG